MSFQDRPKDVVRRAASLLDAAPVLILAAIAGAGSFVHIRDTAAQHGQHGPMSWAIAICIDLTCVTAARERQRDKHTNRVTRRVSWPTIVLASGVLLSLAANLDQAQSTTWGRITAATPAAAFLVAISMLERRAPQGSSDAPSPAVLPVPAQDGSTLPVPAPSLHPAGPLLDYARRVATEHHATHGQPITRDALRTRLGVSNQLASELLRHIRATQARPPERHTVMTRFDFPNPVTRTQVTDGLRQLADYLDTHQDIPIAPYGWDLLVSTHANNDQEGIAEVDRIADILDVPAVDDTADGGHYTANKAFGPISYYAFYIPASQKTRRTSGTDPAHGDPRRRPNDPTTVPEHYAAHEHANGCVQPVLLRGRVDHIDGATGELIHRYSTIHEPGGVLPIACKTRRASRCLPCAETYRADTYQLIRAGLTGGKGIPATVATHRAVFLTLTAPSFGSVHARRERNGRVLPCRPRPKHNVCPHGQTIICTRRHYREDSQLGEPLCPDCYDHTGAVLFNAYAPELWRRFTIALHRAIARQAGLTSKNLRAHARISYAKVAEYQRRGVVHFHAIIRLDGPDGPTTPPPAWASVGQLSTAITERTQDNPRHQPGRVDTPGPHTRLGHRTRHPPDHHQRRTHRHQGRCLRRQVRHQSRRMHRHP